VRSSSPIQLVSASFPFLPPSINKRIYLLILSLLTSTSFFRLLSFFRSLASFSSNVCARQLSSSFSIDQENSARSASFAFPALHYLWARLALTFAPLLAESRAIAQVHSICQASAQSLVLSHPRRLKDTMFEYC
jgi:hypothetical protein